MKARLARMLKVAVSVAVAAAVVAPGSAAARNNPGSTSTTTTTSTTSTTSTTTVQHYCSTGYTLTAISTTTSKYDVNKDGYVCVKVVNKKSSSYADDFSQLLMV